MKKLLIIVSVCLAVASMAHAENVASLISPTADVITSVQSANSVPNLEGTLQTVDSKSTNNSKNTVKSTSTEKRA